MDSRLRGKDIKKQSRVRSRELKYKISHAEACGYREYWVVGAWKMWKRMRRNRAIMIRYDNIYLFRK